MPFLGDTVPLAFQLLDGDNSKFCRAIVKDPAGVSLAQSPVTLVARGNGNYSANTLSMPNLPYLEVTYESFDDALFTDPDNDHLLGGDTFPLEIPDTVIVDSLISIENKLNGLSLGGGGVITRVSQSVINEVIDDTRELRSLIESGASAVCVDRADDTSTEVREQRVNVTVDPLDTGVKN